MIFISEPNGVWKCRVKNRAIPIHFFFRIDCPNVWLGVSWVEAKAMETKGGGVINSTLGSSFSCKTAGCLFGQKGTLTITSSRGDHSSDWLTNERLWNSFHLKEGTWKNRGIISNILSLRWGTEKMSVHGKWSAQLRALQRLFKRHTEYPLALWML